MPRFTKQQMLDELREILLFQADQLWWSATPEIAEAFIGFRRGTEGKNAGDGAYFEQDPAQIDLKRFDITGLIIQAYDYAFYPAISDDDIFDNLRGVMLFAATIPNIDRARDEVLIHTSACPEPKNYMTSEGYCRTASDAAFARWKLDNGSDYNFSPRELALLADMSEGAVRNAMSDKGDSRLKPIPGSKPIRVDHTEALRWLSGRRGFIETNNLVDDRVLREFLDGAFTPQDFGRFVRACFSKKGAESLLPDWSEEEKAAWKKGAIAFDAQKAQQFAECFGLDVPKFTGKVLEISLRRDDTTWSGRAS